jgi:hypothetical protein
MGMGDKHREERLAQPLQALSRRARKDRLSLTVSVSSMATTPWAVWTR